MGAMPRLKKKDEMKYRKGLKDESRICQACLQLVPDFDIPGKGREPRCKVMGLQGSIRYRVRTDHTCDAFTEKEAA